ncbi:GFA family protein [Undibacterium sp.]|uniref:GFA family protein n=1 Tax=Undibacterium sp. TaxID=1914977 RepID=UPI00374CBA4A
MSAQLFQGSCHCGAIKFEVHTVLNPATRCNCSLCRRRGAVMSAAVDESQLQILSGQDALTLYQFNTLAARHFFCKHCGIYPFHQTRLNPKLWRVNVGCLEGVDSYALETSVANGAALSVVEDA